MEQTLQNEFKPYHYLDVVDAHRQGFEAGNSKTSTQQPYKAPVNDYQKEYNRGYKNGQSAR